MRQLSAPPLKNPPHPLPLWHPLLPAPLLNPWLNFQLNPQPEPPIPRLCHWPRPLNLPGPSPEPGLLRKVKIPGPLRLQEVEGVRWKRLRLLLTIQKGGVRQEDEREVAEFMEQLGTALRPDKVPRGHAALLLLS